MSAPITAFTEPGALQPFGILSVFLTLHMPDSCTVLSIVPFRVLPASTGGHWGIVHLHHALGKICDDHIVSTVDNGPATGYSFRLHPVFSAASSRYIQFNKSAEIKKLAKQVGADTIYCDHPYMMPLAISLSRSLKLPLFMRSHNIESDRFRTLGKKWWRLMHAFEQYAMKQSSGVLFVTPEDGKWAIENYHLDPARCHVIPFGTTKSEAPTGHREAKAKLASDLGISPDKPWLYFIGVLDYAPNTDAANFVLNEIMPRLDKDGQDYQAFLVGKGLPQSIQDRMTANPRIRYLGFVDDLDVFLKAADIMLNPVLTGGGIKTKAIEALSYNKMVVSAASGAAGLIRAACGTNLLVAPDNDWDDFAGKTIAAINTTPDITSGFFDCYNWDKIAVKIKAIMQAAT